MNGLILNVLFLCLWLLLRSHFKQKGKQGLFVWYTFLAGMSFEGFLFSLFSVLDL